MDILISVLFVVVGSAVSYFFGYEYGRFEEERRWEKELSKGVPLEELNLQKKSIYKAEINIILEGEDVKKISLVKGTTKKEG